MRKIFELHENDASKLGTKKIKTIISDYKRNGNKATAVLTFTVSLTDFGMKPPSVMGLIKVGNDVKVKCHLTGSLDEKGK